MRTPNGRRTAIVQTVPCHVARAYLCVRDKDVAFFLHLQQAIVDCKNILIAVGKLLMGQRGVMRFSASARGLSWGPETGEL
jgi:hypothetical protein